MDRTSVWPSEHAVTTVIAARAVISNRAATPTRLRVVTELSRIVLPSPGHRPVVYPWPDRIGEPIAGRRAGREVRHAAIG
ncbi:hypothetical protein GCM10009722_32490 [Williamsia deligens]